jgi:hypothetical protein
MITQREIKKILKYNMTTGQFTWKKTMGGAVKGEVAGHLSYQGYVRISIGGRRYFAHTLAWIYVTGNPPKYEIDHIDRCRHNNRWRNLRDIPHTINLTNRKRFSNNSTGTTGIDRENGRFRVRVTVDGRRHYVGSFDRISEAKVARRAFLDLHLSPSRERVDSGNRDSLEAPR